MFLTTDYTEHTDFKVKVTATVLFEAGASDPTWRCPAKHGWSTFDRPSHAGTFKAILDERPDKLRQRREAENVVKSHGGCKSRSIVNSAPLPEAAGFFTPKVYCTLRSIRFAPSRLARLERTVHGLPRGNEKPRAPRRACPV